MHHIAQYLLTKSLKLANLFFQTSQLNDGDKQCIKFGSAHDYTTFKYRRSILDRAAQEKGSKIQVRYKAKLEVRAAAMR